MQEEPREPYLVYQTFNHRGSTTIIVFVDGRLVIRDDGLERDLLKRKLKEEIKDLGKLKKLLEIEVTHLQ